MAAIARLWLAALCLATPASALAAAPAARNVVLIVLDDAGTDLFGAYGEVKAGMAAPPEHLATPNLQELAGRGVVFENAWSGPLCSTTRATILTGQFAFRNGLGGVGSLQPPASAPALYVSLAEHLGTAPVRSLRSIIGKWHVTNFSATCSALPPADPYLPTEAGFTQYQGYPNAGGSQFGWCEVVDGAGPTEPCDGPNEDPSSWPPICAGREAYETSAEVDRAIRFLDEAPSEPWFLQLSLHSVHTPLEAPPPALHSQPTILASYAEGQLAAAGDERAMREAMLQAMDTELGRFLDRLELWDCGSDDCHLSRTTVIFVGDNGTDEPLPTSVNRDEKASIYEGGINVPLIVTGDAVNAARRGTTTAALVHTVDLYATIHQMTGRSAPAGVTLDSVSFAGLLSGTGGTGPRSCVYADGRFASLAAAARDRHHTAARNQTHKLIRLANTTSGITGYELYAEGASGHLDEATPLSIPLDASDPNWASYQQLLAQLDAASPCLPSAPPSCGLGAELAPLLGLLLLRRRYSA